MKRALVACALLGIGCASAHAPGAQSPTPGERRGDDGEAVVFPSTYERREAPPVLIRNATVLTAAGPRIENGSVLMRDGKIVAVGRDIDAPPGVRVIDATGKWVTPGVIDSHSHLGDYPAPGVDAVSDGNEMVNPNTAEVWAEHSVWPQDPQFDLARAGGITALQILPGSANLFGGRGVTVKNVPSVTVQGMKFPGAPYGLKMACGENPKRVYGQRGGPATRMGNVAGYRTGWIRAAQYLEDMKSDGRRPTRDLELETLAGVLEGDILVQHHGYRADEMAQVIDVADEFGYKVSSFHHAVEAYKIGELLKERDICASIWADWWGFKLEAYDGIKQNAALLHQDGACIIIHSDDAQGIQRLNQEAAKAMAAGNQNGIRITHEDAIRWITINPAKAIGVDGMTGSLEPGKMADVVIWDGDPFSVYTKAEKVFIDGALLFDRLDPTTHHQSDFMLGILPREVTR